MDYNAGPPRHFVARGDDFAARGRHLRGAKRKRSEVVIPRSAAPWESSKTIGAQRFLIMTFLRNVLFYNQLR